MTGVQTCALPISIIKNDVLKREIMDSQEAKDALEKYIKIIKKLEKKKLKDKESLATEKINEIFTDTPTIASEIL